MKKPTLLTILLFILFSCDKYPYPGVEILEMLEFQVVGNNQVVEFGQYFTDSVGIIIDLGSLKINNGDKFRMEVEVLEGGGAVDQTVIYSDGNGKILTRWKPGSKSNSQKLNATIYDSEGRFLTKTQIVGITYFFGEWNTISSGYLTRINDMVADTINQRSMMILSGKLYKNGPDFMHWEKIPANNFTFARTIEINSHGNLFVGASDGCLYKSSDWGVSWQSCSKPIPDYSGIFQLTVTPDDYIWVSRWEHGIRCSKDGGFTWQKDTTGLAIEEEMGRVYRLNDGSHIALSQNQLAILRSFDDGITWIPVNTPIYSLSCFATDKDEIIALNQENGYTIFKSTNFGQTYKKMQSFPTAYHSFPLYNTFAKYGNDYFMLLPGSGIYKTQDFESFESLLNFEVQLFLFIDHRGTLYASGLSNDPVHILSR